MFGEQDRKAGSIIVQQDAHVPSLERSLTFEKAVHVLVGVVAGHDDGLRSAPQRIFLGCGHHLHHLRTEEQEGRTETDMVRQEKIEKNEQSNGWIVGECSRAHRGERASTHKHLFRNGARSHMGVEGVVGKRGKVVVQTSGFAVLDSNISSA